MKDRLTRIENWEELAVEAAFRPEAMAALCPISLRQLQRFFITRFNQTPSRWIREVRCRLARDLIAQGLPNKAVVQDLDFANESHLCHEFKRCFGVSPQTFSPFHRATSGSKPTSSHLPLNPLPLLSPHRVRPSSDSGPRPLAPNSPPDSTQTSLSRLDNTTRLNNSLPRRESEKNSSKCAPVPIHSTFGQAPCLPSL